MVPLISSATGGLGRDAGGILNLSFSLPNFVPVERHAILFSSFFAASSINFPCLYIRHCYPIAMLDKYLKAIPFAHFLLSTIFNIFSFTTRKTLAIFWLWHKCPKTISFMATRYFVVYPFSTSNT